jgi:3-oxoacyl-[acyl-carrier-protein] synthase-3
MIGARIAGTGHHLPSRVVTDADLAPMLMAEAPSSRQGPRIAPEHIAEDRHLPRMQGQAVFRQAVTRLPDVIRELLLPRGLKPLDLDLLVPHQANLRIMERVASSLDLLPEKMFTNIQKYGNTIAASIPIALHEARRSGRVGSGALVCLAAFGAGLTWGATLVRW